MSSQFPMEKTLASMTNDDPLKVGLALWKRTFFLAVALVSSRLVNGAEDLGNSTDSAVVHRAFGGLQPCISPDGRQIALSFQGAICRMPSVGGTLVRLTRDEGWDIEPTWSPDGRWIAYIHSGNFS